MKRRVIVLFISNLLNDGVGDENYKKPTIFRRP